MVPAVVRAATEAARHALATATEPVVVNRVRVEAEAMRDMLGKAMSIAGEDGPRLALLKREAEELVLNAMLKLGAMVPAPVEGASKGHPAKVRTVRTFAEDVGISRRTAQRLRDLHEARVANEDEFGEIVNAALVAGESVPLSRLYALGRYGHTPEPQARSWLSSAVSSAIKTRSMFMDIEKNTEAPPDVRSAARAYLKATKEACEQVAFALNREKTA